MRNMRMGLTVCLLLGAAATLLLLPDTAAAAAAASVELCASTLLPSLFPYFVLTELWVLLGAAEALGRGAARWMGPLFHLPGAAAPALLLGAIGGYPVGAQAVGRLYSQGALTKAEAEQTLLFCNNAGPAFVLGVAGGGLFGSPGLGAVLLAIHLGAAMLLGMILRPETRPTAREGLPAEGPAMSLQAALPLAVRQAGSSFFSVCLFVVFFSVITALLTALVPAPVADSGPFTLALGALELAGGIARLASLSWAGPWLFASAAGLLGFGGLCVQLQTQAILSRFGLSGKTFRRGKLLQGLLSTALALIFAPLLPLPAACWSGNPASPPGLPWLFGAATLVLAVFFRPHAKLPSGNPDENRL